MSSNPSDLVAFFDSVAPLYPGGVPRAAVSENRGSAANSGEKVRWHGASNGGLLFIGFAPGGASLLEGEAGELLHAAITKGLKQDPSKVTFLALAEGVTGEEVTATLQRFSPRVGVALGEEVARLLGLALSPGSWSHANGCGWRVTVRPSDVLKDTSLKRTMWNDLQAVLQQLGSDL